MKISMTTAVLAVLPLFGQAWIPQLNTQNMKKAASAATVGAAIVSAPVIANALDYSGSFEDPNHPNCVRRIENIGKIATIEGTDGDPGCQPNGKGKDEFQLLAAVENGELIIDFTPKGGPNNVAAKWEGGDTPGIRFPDGNKWTQK
jgi:hypothetical protein